MKKERPPCVRVGISGWRYAPWRGGFYPDRLRQDDELRYASQRLGAIEINGTFYSLQRPELFQKWRAQTRPGFRFAVKGGRFITHMKKLKEVEIPLANFFASGVLALEEKLGPVLWQFPEALTYDPGRFEAFFQQLPISNHQAAALARRHDARLDGRSYTEVGALRPLRHAIEIRHPSFLCDAFVEQLRRHRIAMVVADTGGRFVRSEDVTADFVYVRLHGPAELYRSGYAPRQLADWARRIDAWARSGDPTTRGPPALRSCPPADPGTCGASSTTPT